MNINSRLIVSQDGYLLRKIVVGQRNLTEFMLFRREFQEGFSVLRAGGVGSEETTNEVTGKLQWSREDTTR